MCGIFGFVGNRYEAKDADLSLMRESLTHRGPDHFDFFSFTTDQDFEVNFGHVRLSIIDTSEAGSQPMHSHSGRYVIVFNGEIYNFLDIKAEILSKKPDIKWNSTSDTEVLLAGIELFGLNECVSKLVGMFAFALLDKESQRVFLVRDRIGEKPLYYGYQKDQFIFSSELKAFEAHSKFEKKINTQAAVGFLLRSCIPQSLSIYQNVYKVVPGRILEFTFEDIKQKSQPAEFTYWSLKDIVYKNQNSFKGTYEEAITTLENILIRSVQNQSISDVPLGAFLSGGIDSSLVCALYKKHVNSNLFTFTIGMPEPGKNEAVHAEKVANAIGTMHEAKYLNTEEIISRVDEIINYWDEPFADSSQIPTFFVSELAKKQITVSLSGDGADEFGYGYTDYPIYKQYKHLNLISKLGLKKLLSIVGKIPGIAENNKFKKISNFAYLLNLLRSNNLNEIHAKWRNKFREEELPLRKQYIKEQDKFLNVEDLGFDYAGYYDALAYLPDDIMVKVDRAAMAVSLESRAPFLDHRVIEFLISLPMEYKYENGVSKKILKDILYKYVPKDIIDRPKQGFSIPLTEWLREELKDWAFKIINNIPSDSTFWNKKTVLKIWNEHQNLSKDHTEQLWNIIVLENFFKKREINFN
ncbi:Asparagine synthetase (glutamine-hydrolyzing) 1 [Elizabethkingia miricola]|nr:Asparagine synthetase (glutamine-hydrolyzing) 1 [Elizabethkingia miricola]